MAEGILYQGFFVQKENFINLFVQDMEKNGENFKKELQEILDILQNRFSDSKRHIYDYYGYVKKDNDVTKDFGRKIFKRWDEIQEKYFGNKPVTLLATFFIDGTDNFIMDTNLDAEINSISQNGKIKVTKKKLEDLINLSDKIDMQQLYLSVLNKHYQDLVKSLEYVVNKDEAHTLHKRFPKRHGHGWTGRSLNSIFYSGKSSFGNRWDGYLNHVAEEEPYLLDILQDGGALKPISIRQVNHTFPFGEKIFHVIENSLNNIPWYTGGDLIVLNGDGSVAYNIQLKSTTRDEAEWLIRLSGFYTMIHNIMDQNDYRNMAEEIYNELKTKSSGQISQGGQKIENIIYEWVENKLKVK